MPPFLIWYYIEKTEIRQIQISTFFNMVVIDKTNMIRYNERSLAEEMVYFYENIVEKCTCCYHE